MLGAACFDCAICTDRSAIKGPLHALENSFALRYAVDGFTY